MQAKLVPLDDGQPYQLDKPVTVVGRRKFVCNLYLPDRRVSQLHCVIRRTDSGDLVVRDLGSTNGTRVNGRKVTEGLLMPGDELTFAAARFRLQLEAGEEEPGRQPPGEPGAALGRKDEGGSIGPSGTRRKDESGRRELPAPPVPSPFAAEEHDEAKDDRSSTAKSFALAGKPESEDERPEAEDARVAAPVEASSAVRQGDSPDIQASWIRRPADSPDRSVLPDAPEPAASPPPQPETEHTRSDSVLDEDLAPDGSGGPAEEQTEIISNADDDSFLDDWADFSGRAASVDVSPYNCPACKKSRLVRAPFPFWQLPLALLSLRPHCCPRCFRRFIRPNA